MNLQADSSNGLKTASQTFRFGWIDSPSEQEHPQSGTCGIARECATAHMTRWPCAVPETTRPACFVSDAGRFKERRQVFAIELGIAPRTWDGSHSTRCRALWLPLRELCKVI